MIKKWFVVSVDASAGRTLMKRLLDGGDRVVTTARNPLLLDDLKTRHATTLTILTADDPADAVDRTFTEHGPIDVIVGPEALLPRMVPHLVAQGGGTVIQSAGPDHPGMTVRITATPRDPDNPSHWAPGIRTTARDGTPLTEEQLNGLVPGLWGHPAPEHGRPPQ